MLPLTTDGIRNAARSSAGTLPKKNGRREPKQRPTNSARLCERSSGDDVAAKMAKTMLKQDFTTSDRLLVTGRAEMAAVTSMTTYMT